MTDDVFVDGLSAREIETRAVAWRDVFGINEQWVPDVIRLLEHDLGRLYPAFSLVVRSDASMLDAEAYTQFTPPQIVLRESVYTGALKGDGRHRMTTAHELGHLLLHKGLLKARSLVPFDSRKNKVFHSAEWQARKFAAYFLMPEHIVRQFGSPAELATGCCVSTQAAQIRFEETRHLRPRQVPDFVSEFLKNN